MTCLLSRFVRRDDGVATIETVLWFPFLIALFGLMFDATMVFNTQARIMRVIQDGNREYSIGNLADMTATEDFIENRLSGINIKATAASRVTAGVVTTVVTVRAPEMDMIGYFSAIRNVVFTVSAYQMVENWET